MKLPYGYDLMNGEIVIHEEKAAMDKLLSKKYIPVVGVNVYLDVQFKKNRRCNVDRDKTGHSRKTVRYRAPILEVK